MGETVAKIVLAILGVVAGYNILTHGSAASGIVNSTAGGSATVIKSLQGR
jgi:hypothetical protein